MKFSPSIAAFGAGALAAAVAVVTLGPKPADGTSAGDATLALDAAQQRVDRLEAALASLTAQVTELGATARNSASPAPVVPTASAVRKGARAPATDDADRQRVTAAAAVQASAGMALQAQAVREYLEANQNPEASLIEAGFTAERAREIIAFHDALAEATLADANGLEAGQKSDPGAIDGPGLQRILREELGETEYERYRRALRRSTAVHIDRVLPGSLAESAGLLRGDVIRSYGGHRVMELREIEEVAAESRRGEPVLLEVQRGDERIYISTVHGTLGVTELSFMSRIARELEQAGQGSQAQGR